MKRTFFFSFLLVSLAGALVWRSLNPPFPRPDSPPILYLHPSSVDLRYLLLQAIERARETIFFSIFGLSDTQILASLTKKKIPMTLVYDPAHSGKLCFDKKVLQPIRQKGLMHQKIFVFDDSTVFFGSANLTLSSLKMHDNLLVGLYSPEVASFFKAHIPDKPGHLRTLVGNQPLELWLLPDPSLAPLQALKTKIAEAKTSIKIALFTLTHPDLVEEIARAHERNVNVAVFLDSYSAQGASKQAAQKLLQRGVPLFFSRGGELLHHKLAYIDKESLISGSANWTRSAFEKNSDLLFCLSQLSLSQVQKIDHLFVRLFALAKEPPPSL